MVDSQIQALSYAISTFTPLGMLAFYSEQLLSALRSVPILNLYRYTSASSILRHGLDALSFPKHCGFAIKDCSWQSMAVVEQDFVTVIARLFMNFRGVQ